MMPWAVSSWFARAVGKPAAVFLVLAATVAPAAAEQTTDILNAVVGVISDIPPEARTSETLGTERQGSGVVIGEDGLVLTIGYLILEARDARVITPGGDFVPADIVGYDHDTGFGLLRAKRGLGIKPVSLGDSADLATDDKVLVVSFGSSAPVTPARVAARRTFTGYWEYLLENAIFTVPPHAQYGGAALIGADGNLLGIGSLFVGEAKPGPRPGPGNMFVPIDALKPILDDLVRTGRSSRPSHPWLGVYTRESQGRVFVTRTAPGGPAEKAGLRTGDIIMGVGGKRVKDMADFLRKVWARGDAGVEVPVDILSMDAADLSIRQVPVPSLDRYDWLKLKPGM